VGGNNPSADDIEVDPNETSLASRESGTKCYKCREQGHKAYRCPKKNANANSGSDRRYTGKCHHCGEMGTRHTSAGRKTRMRTFVQGDGNPRWVAQGQEGLQQALRF